MRYRFYRFSVLIFILIVAVLNGVTLTSAEEKRPMTLIDILEVPSLTDPRLSHDGEYVLYVLAETDWQQNRQISHIWRIRTDGTERLKITNGENDETSPRWSPNSQKIAFITKRGNDKHNQIYLINNTGGEAYKYTTHSTAVSDIQWSPDSKWIYFLTHDPKTEEEQKDEKDKDDVYVYDEDFKHKHLWRKSLADKSKQKITDGEYSIIGYNLSKDGTQISYHSARTPLFDDSNEGDIWIMDADGQNHHQLTNNTVREWKAQLSPDNSRVLFLSNSNEQFEFYYNTNLFIASSSGGKPRMLLKNMPYEIQAAHWANSNKHIYLVANTGIRTQLFRVNIKTEEYLQLTTGDHDLRFWSYESDLDQHVYALRQPHNAGDVWLLSKSNNKVPHKVTQEYDYLSKEFQLPRQEMVQWTGVDGQLIEGLLTFALDYRKGKSYPLVVRTHGGPASSTKFGFGQWLFYPEVLAAKGYVYFDPNYRGSTGYGDEFLRDMVGHYYQKAHLDVIAGVDYLIEQGIADGDRMAKTGWSAGGHMTNKIITFTDRFKAASSGAGAVNWISMYGQSDVRIYRTPWFGGTPWQKDAPIETYWNHSPLKDIWKVTTPTLVIVGENDLRVPMAQSVELYRALKSNGVPTHLYVAPREPHQWKELRHRLYKLNIELEWFEKYVMEREYEWEKIPKMKTEEAD